MTARVLAVFAVTLVVAPTAAAAIFIRLTTTTVHRGGPVRVVGNAHAMPIYAIRTRRLPLCRRYDTCAELERRARPPRTPYIRIGQVPDDTRAFALRLPLSLRPGKYRVFVWCKSCGGSLIPAAGQLRVLP